MKIDCLRSIQTQDEYKRVTVHAIIGLASFTITLGTALTCTLLNVTFLAFTILSSTSALPVGYGIFCAYRLDQFQKRPFRLLKNG